MAKETALQRTGITAQMHLNDRSRPADDLSDKNRYVVTINGIPLVISFEARPRS